MPTVEPLMTMRPGNRSELRLDRQLDPIYLAQRRWNEELVLGGEPPSGSEAPRDGVAYTPAGSAQACCWPHLKVAWRSGLQPGPGPNLQFRPDDDGLHLSVVFQEDPARRVAGALPFDVKVTSVRLVYGPGPADQLDFPELLVEPLPDTQGPAFSVEADARVPLDESRARLVAALQTAGTARWVVAMEFQWVQTLTTPAPPPDPGDGPFLPDRFHDRLPIRQPFGQRFQPLSAAQPLQAAPRALQAMTLDPSLLQATMAPQHRLVGRSDLLREILVRRRRPVVTTSLQTLRFERSIAAEYPNNTPENRPIYAAVTGDYAQFRWQNGAHGWFQPTPILDTVYCLPQAYRLEVDAATGLPAIHAVLLRKNAQGTLDDSLDPRHYTVRLSMKVRPHFDIEQLQALRTRIRAESDNSIPFVDLVFGGYAAARFEPDPSLAGLGELFAGSSAGGRDTINPEQGFTLTYEGQAEFIELLFGRLKGDGIGGSVVLDLQDPGGRIVKHSVPVALTLRQLASVSLPWTFDGAQVSAPAPAAPPAEPPAAPAAPDAAPAAAPAAEGAEAIPSLPRTITLRNPMAVAVQVGALAAFALQKSPITGRVQAWTRAAPDGSWPRTLAPGESVAVALAFEDAQLLYNTWDLSLVDCHTRVSSELVLSSLFDAASSGVRGWRVAVDCPPLAFFDQLSAEDQARVKDIVALEVELRRLGSTDVEEVRLTRQAPAGSVLLSRTVADFVSDRSVGRSSFEYRQRSLRVARADDWSAWRQETGSAVSVFLA